MSSITGDFWRRPIRQSWRKLQSLRIALASQLSQLCKFIGVASSVKSLSKRHFEFHKLAG